LLVTVTGGLSGYPLVKVHGELDFSNRGRLEANIERVLRTDPGVVILDLRSLRFIDSSGLHVILRADRLARGSGARLVIVPGPEHVMRSFAWVGLDRRLTFAERPATDALEPDPARA
jgi:anti-anti-sigma factor